MIKRMVETISMIDLPLVYLNGVELEMIVKMESVNQIVTDTLDVAFSLNVNCCSSLVTKHNLYILTESAVKIIYINF